MSRATIAFDRAATFLLAVVLILAGAGLIVWWLDLFSWLPGRVDVAGARDIIAQTWWPWAVGATGLLAVLAGLRWMIAHVPDRGVGDLTLTGSGPAGKLRAAPRPLAQAAAHELAAAPGVRSATGTIIRERGQIVARLVATMEAGADLHTVAAAADAVAADLGAVLGRGDLHCQVQLKVAARTRALPRVT